jgi:hypothetical protein
MIVPVTLVSYATGAASTASMNYYILELAILNRSMSVAPMASRESMMEDESLVCTSALTATPTISLHIHHMACKYHGTAWWTTN